MSRRPNNYRNVEAAQRISACSAVLELLVGFPQNLRALRRAGLEPPYTDACAERAEELTRGYLTGLGVEDPQARIDAVRADQERARPTPVR